MTFLETEMKELGRGTQHNTHNTRSLIRTLKYVPDIVADGRRLYSEKIKKHTHTHTHESIKSNNIWFDFFSYRGAGCLV